MATGHKQLTAEEKVTRALAFYTHANEEHYPRFKQIRKNNSMYRGDQWNAENKAKLRAEGRPTLTLNILGPLCRQLIGVFDSAKTIFKAVPADKDSDPGVAKTIDKLMLQIENNNDGDLIDDQVFAAGLISSRSCMNIDVSFELEPLGEVVLEDDEVTEVLLDPSAKSPYQKDWRRVIKAKWMTPEDMKLQWGDKLTEDDFNQDVNRTWWEEFTDRIKSVFRTEGSSEDDFLLGGKYKILELWERRKRKIQTWIDPQGNAVEQPDEFTDGEMIFAGYQLSEELSHYMNVTIIFPFTQKVLDEYEEPYYYFPWAFYFPMYTHGLLIDCLGYIEDMEGVQEEKNRLRSVANDIIARAPNNVTLLPPGNETLAEELRQTGSQPNGYYTLKSKGSIERLDAKYPTGVKDLSNENNVDTRILSGQPLAMGGVSETSDESGVLFGQKVKQGLSASSIIFRNWDRYKKLRGRIELERIQRTYTEARIIRVVGKEEAEDIMINYPDAMGSITNDLTIGKYDLAIDEAPFVKSMQQQELQGMSEVLKTLAAGMPPDIGLYMFAIFMENTGLDNAKETSQWLITRAGEMAVQTGGTPPPGAEPQQQQQLPPGQPQPNIQQGIPAF